MFANAHEKAAFALTKAVTLAKDELRYNYPMAWEADRWNELVYALLTRVTDQPEDSIRALVTTMGEMHYGSRSLLDIPALAKIQRVGQGADPTDNEAQEILRILEEEGGFRLEDARRGLAAICDAARGLQEHYQGKVQFYLRHYGELMLKELGETFRFSTLSDEEVGYAFTLWFQNVLNMPLSLIDKHVKEFCKQHEIEPKQLIAAADDKNFNLALVDDLVGHYLDRQRRAAETRTKQSQEKAPVQESEEVVYG